MLNVVIPIVNNPKSYDKLVTNLKDVEDVNILIGTTPLLCSKIEHLAGENVSIIEFEENSKREEIINGLQKYVDVGAVMILRKAISIDEFYQFVNNKRDIVLCKNSNGTIKKFFLSIWQKILKTFLGIKVYDGDTSVILFKEDISTVLMETNDLSFSSRVDRWRGVKQGTVSVSGEMVKTEVDVKNNIKYLVFALLALIIGAVVTTCVCVFVNVNIIVGLLLICLDIICLSISLIMIVITIFNCMVGKKSFKPAIEVVIDDYNSEQEEGE